MKIDMRPEAITRRLRKVAQLRKVCLELARSSTGLEIRRKKAANESVQRTAEAPGR